MTLIYAYQGKNKAFVASDLLLRLVSSENLGLPPQLQPQERYIIEKFRPTIEGNYVAFHGSLNHHETQVIERTPMSKLMTSPLSSFPGFRPGRAVIVYVDVGNAQIYRSSTENVIQPISEGSFSVAGAKEELAIRFYETTLNLTKRFDSNSLIAKHLPKAIRRIFLEEEKANPLLGGFASYKVTPGQFTPYVMEEGKIKGLTRAVFDNGTLFSEIDESNQSKI